MHRCVIVIPCYNEAVRIDSTTFFRFADRHSDVGFVMVNDGSTDNTLDVLRRLTQHNGSAFRVLDLPDNVGKAAAVRSGILHALESGADFVGYWDADLATPLDAITDLLQVLEAQPEVQLVIGSRVRLLGHAIDRHPLRHLLGRCFAAAVSLLMQLPAYDTQCGAKIFRSGPAVRGVFLSPFRTNWIFDVELLVRLDRAQPKGPGKIRTCVREIPLRAWKDVPGSKLRPADFLWSFLELAFLAWICRQPAQPAEQPGAPREIAQPRGSRQLKRHAA